MEDVHLLAYGKLWEVGWHYKGKKYNPTGQHVYQFRGYDTKGDTLRAFKRKYPWAVIDYMNEV